VKKKTLLSTAFVLICAAGAASLAHPFGNVRTARSSAPLLADAPVPSAVMGIVSRSCQNCHSEKTEWPVYSLVAPMSWMVEKDVRDARSHMNLSRWNDYDSDQRQQILSELGSLVRNKQMPPRRYLLLHPEARLSDSDSDQLYQWTRSERKRLKAQRPVTAGTIWPALDISRFHLPMPRDHF
jgi:Haem-binding domain